MENDNYGKLIEFLGKKFEKIDEHFEAIDDRFEAMDGLHKDAVHQNGILHEEARHNMQAIVDGLKTLDEKRERDKDELLTAIGRLERNDMLMHADIDNHEGRITQLEKKA